MKKKRDEGAPGAEDAATDAGAAPPEATPDTAAEWRDKYLRALAELDNYRKRVEREREIARIYATDALLREVLPVVDDLETALKIEGKLDAIRDGVALALRHLANALEAKGMKQIEALGKPFDPRFHEAMGFVPAPGKAPGTVVVELKKGYVFHDRVLRPARVQIAMAPPPAKAEADQANGAGEED
jgi:molecular chaperone GrpE